MYTISCGSPSLLFKEIYKCSDKHETLLVETALVKQPQFYNSQSVIFP